MIWLVTHGETNQIQDGLLTLEETQKTEVPSTGFMKTTDVPTVTAEEIDVIIHVVGTIFLQVKTTFSLVAVKTKQKLLQGLDYNA